MIKRASPLLLAIFFFTTLLPQLYAQEATLLARPFDPNYILDDIELVQADAISAPAIQRFLDAQPGALGRYRGLDVDGIERSAAEIIWMAAQRSTINPKFLIVLLQKEQSLIEDPTPSVDQFDWAVGYGVCDSCSKDDPAIQKFRGFATQLDRSAARQRYYLEHPYEFGVRKNEPILIDNVLVTPASQATANLYIYTPHLRGNENFWKIWQRYFARAYPDGSVLSDASTGDIWLLQNGLRRQFGSRSIVYADYSEKQIITVSHLDLQRYDIGLPIRFPTYSLLRSPKGTVYLLVNDTRRGIASREVFRAIGYNPEEVIDATWDDLNAYPEGLPIVAATDNPTGELWQDNKTGGVYYVAEGIRHPIWAREIMNSRFPGSKPKMVTTATLEKLPVGDPVGFREGSLIVATGAPSVYVISAGQRRAILSEDVFNELGYRWDSIIRTSPKALEAQSEGLPITG